MKKMNILHCLNDVVTSAELQCKIIINDIHISVFFEKNEDILYLKDYVMVRSKDNCKPDYSIYMASLKMDTKLQLTDLIEKEKDYVIQNHLTDFHYCHTQDIGQLFVKVFYRNECSYFIVQCENVFYILYDENYSNKNSLVLYVVRELIYRESESRGCVCFHAASCRFKNIGVVFLGDSGAGKTSLLVAFMQKMKADFISNDRVLVNTTFDIFPLPMPIRISPGTIVGNYILHNFIVTNASQLRRLSSKQADEITSGDIKKSKNKLELTPREISECFSVKRLDSAKLRMIIIPKYDSHRKGILMDVLDSKSAKDILVRNCYTPNDPLWIFPWFGRRKISSDAILGTIDEIIEKTPVYQLVFGPDICLDMEKDCTICSLLSYQKPKNKKA